MHGKEFKVIAQTYAAQHGLKSIEDYLEGTEWTPFDYRKANDVPEADKKKFWDHASQAMAELSSGTVYVLLPKEITVGNFYRSSVWADVEWEALKKNTKVTAVIYVNPENGDKQYFKGGPGHKMQ